MISRYVALGFSFFLSFSTFAQAGECEEAVLRDLGWEVERLPKTETFSLRANGLCDEADTAAVVLASDLSRFLRSPENRCRYQRRLAPAAAQAAEKFERNSSYRFSGLRRFMKVPKAWHTEGPRGGWFRGRALARPDSDTRPSQAIESFYQDRARAECAVGRQLMELAVQYELYGAEAFDRAFSGPGDLRIGAWSSHWEAGGNAIYSRDGHVDVNQREEAELGPYAWNGLSLYLQNVKGESYLDTPNDRGENAVIVKVSTEANDRFRADSRRMTEIVDDLALRMWEAASVFRNRLRADHEGLIRKLMSGKIADESALERELSGLRWNEENAQAAREVFALSLRPELKGIEVFVHPLGRKSLSFHLLRLLVLNPRTPYRLWIENGRIRDRMFEKYVDFRLASCRGERP